MKFVFCSKNNTHKYLEDADWILVKPVMTDEESFKIETPRLMDEKRATEMAQMEFEYYLRYSTLENVVRRLRAAKKGLKGEAWKSLNAFENALIDEFDLYDV